MAEPPGPLPPPVGSHVVCIHDFEGREPGSLRMSKGDVISISSGSHRGGWWCGLNGADRGFFPHSVVTVINGPLNLFSGIGAPPPPRPASPPIVVCRSESPPPPYPANVKLSPPRVNDPSPRSNSYPTSSLAHASVGSRGAPTQPPACTVLVTELPENWVTQNLESLLARFGPIEKGYVRPFSQVGYLTFVRGEDAEKAVRFANGIEVVDQKTGAIKKLSASAHVDLHHCAGLDLGPFQDFPVMRGNGPANTPSNAYPRPVPSPTFPQNPPPPVLPPWPVPVPGAVPGPGPARAFSDRGPSPGIANSHDGGSRHLIVSSLPPFWNTADLEKFFSTFGPIESARIPVAGGSGFVKFLHRFSADAALKGANGMEVPDVHRPGIMTRIQVTRAGEAPAPAPVPTPAHLPSSTNQPLRQPMPITSSSFSASSSSSLVELSPLSRLPYPPPPGRDVRDVRDIINIDEGSFRGGAPPPPGGLLAQDRRLSGPRVPNDVSPFDPPPLPPHTPAGHSIASIPTRSAPAPFPPGSSGPNRSQIFPPLPPSPAPPPPPYSGRAPNSLPPYPSPAPPPGPVPILENRDGRDPRKLMVRCLPPSWRDDDLHQFFEEFGRVKNTRVIFDRSTNQSKCFGFVEYETFEGADAALLKADGVKILDTQLWVHRADRYTPRPPQHNEPANDSANRGRAPAPSINVEFSLILPVEVEPTVKHLTDMGISRSEAQVAALGTNSAIEAVKWVFSASKEEKQRLTDFCLDLLNQKQKEIREGIRAPPVVIDVDDDPDEAVKAEPASVLVNRELRSLQRQHTSSAPSSSSSRESTPRPPPSQSSSSSSSQQQPPDTRQPYRPSAYTSNNAPSSSASFSSSLPSSSTASSSNPASSSAPSSSNAPPTTSTSSSQPQSDQQQPSDAEPAAKKPRPLPSPGTTAGKIQNAKPLPTGYCPFPPKKQK